MNWILIDIHIITLIQLVNFNVRFKELLYIIVADHTYIFTNYTKILTKSVITLNLIENN